MGNKQKERMGKRKPQQTDAGSEPDECAGQTDTARDARDGAGQAEEGQWDTQGRRQALAQLEGPPEGRARGTEAAVGWRDQRGELQGTTRGESRTQGHKQGGREGAGRARARRCGAEGRANEAEGKRVSWAARCPYQAEGQAGCAGGQARAAGELPGVRQAEREGGQEDTQGERED